MRLPNIFAVLAGSRDVFYFTDTTGYGGAEKSLLTLIEGLDRQRWRPTLLYHEDDDLGGFIPARTGLVCRCGRCHACRRG